MRHYIPPPSFDPSIMVDVDALRKELMADQNETMDDGMMLEEDYEDNAAEGMDMDVLN